MPKGRRCRGTHRPSRVRSTFVSLFRRGPLAIQTLCLQLIAQSCKGLVVRNVAQVCDISRWSARAGRDSVGLVGVSVNIILNDHLLPNSLGAWLTSLLVLALGDFAQRLPFLVWVDCVILLSPR
jgi:hypothetical protein